MPKLVILSAFIGNERSVSSLLNYRALVEHGDFVAELTRGQAVGDVDCGFITCNFVKFSVDLGFGNRVESCRRPVEDNTRSSLAEHTGNGAFSSYNDKTFVAILFSKEISCSTTIIVGL